MFKSTRDWSEVIKQLTLFDDVMMTACFDDKETIQEVLRIILKKTFLVKKVTVQQDNGPSYYHGTRFDVLAIDEKGKLCNIEVQQKDDGALVERASFYSGRLSTMALKKGEDYSKLRETYVIFITASDIFRRNLPIYNIKRRFDDNMEVFNDGSFILFVNGSYSGNDELGQFVHDMKECDPNKMYNKILSKRLSLFKSTDKSVDKGGKNMSGIMESLYTKWAEEGRQEGRQEGRLSSAKAMLFDGLDIPTIARYTSLPLEEVTKLQDSIGVRK